MMIGVDARGYLAAFESQPCSAAHSMDTDWYAVDRSGAVAHLWSGDEGAVPWLAHRQVWAKLFEDLAVSRIQALAPATTRQVLSIESDIHAIAPTALPGQWSGVLRFASRDFLDMYRAEIVHADWRVVDETTHTVATSNILKYAFDDYWAAGAIQSAYVIGPQVLPRALGLYEYACDFSGPYTRQAVPADPMRIDALSPSIQRALAALRIDRLDFHATTSFDPSTFLDCQTYRS